MEGVGSFRVELDCLSFNPSGRLENVVRTDYCGTLERLHVDGRMHQTKPHTQNLTNAQAKTTAQADKMSRTQTSSWPPAQTRFDSIDID